MLYLAARSGHKEVLEYLLERAPTAEAVNYGALAAGAAIAGHESALDVLRSRAQRGGAWHPWALHGCVLCGHEELVAKLLAQGAAQDTDATGTQSLKSLK